MGKAIICDLGKSRSFGRLSLKAKVLWPMLLVACDDQGRGDASPDVVKWYICPNVDEITQDNIPELFAEMVEQKMMHLYEDSHGVQLFQLVQWWRYQSPQWAQPSKYPAPEGWTDRIRYNVKGEGYVEDGWNTAGGFLDGNNPGGHPTYPHVGGPTKEKKRKEEKIREEEEKRNAFGAYEAATATALSPMMAERIGALIDDCESHRLGLPPPAAGADATGDEWVQAAIEHAVESNTQGHISYKFVESIAERWMGEGFKAPFKPNNGRDTQSKSLEAIEQWEL